MTKPDMYLIGVGDDGLEGIASKTKKILVNAATVFGGKRHLEMLEREQISYTKTILWKSPIQDSLDDIKCALAPIVILASGEPMWYGIGRLLCQHFPEHSLTIIPTVGSFSLCCARLGWQLEDVATLSLHNRPASYLLRYLQDQRKIVMLTKNKKTLSEVANILTATSYENDPLYVLEHLNGKNENISATTPRQYLENPFPVSDLYCIALETAIHIKKQQEAYPLFGLADDALCHDGMLTKSRIRTITIADLKPRARAILWDIGAGCGSISVEWMRLGGKAYAIETSKKRLRLMKKNIKKFGLEDMVIVEGLAPAGCANFPTPDSIFIGGGLSKDSSLLDFCYQHLPLGGVLVANAVTLESERLLLQAHHHYGGNLSRINITDAVQVGESSLHGWKPSMPITHYVLQKS